MKIYYFFTFHSDSFCLLRHILLQDFFVFENDLEGTLVLRQPLDYETLSSFTVGIRAQDQGTPPQITDTVLQVNVVDADDQNPRFFDDRYTAHLPDPPTQVNMINLIFIVIEASMAKDYFNHRSHKMDTAEMHSPI